MADAPATDRDDIIVVTGLPRSGTSLMMQILEAGGIPVLTDGRRTPDPSNPRGYFEDERVKRLITADASWLDEARGRAVKIIVQLLPFLPIGPRYRVLLMQRDMAEILRSQSAMLAALGVASASDHATLAGAFERHLSAAGEFLRRHPDTTTETINHRDLITSPRPVLDRIARALDRPDLDRDAMLRTIDPQLYRSRSDPTTP